MILVIGDENKRVTKCGNVKLHLLMAQKQELKHQRYLPDFTRYKKSFLS